MVQKFSIYFLLLFSFVFNLEAQENELKYSKKITISEGLAHDGVTSILKDNSGFIWIGTYEGINKYDGYKLITYKNTVDKDILTSNRVRALAQDIHNNLWIGTDEGITIYKTTEEKFIKINSNSSIEKKNSAPIIRKIFLNKSKNRIYCLTEGNGILLYNEKYQLINQFIPLIDKQNELIFFDAKEIDDNHIVFSTSNGLYLFDVENNSFQHILKNEINFSNAIIALNKSLFITTVSNGFVIFSYDQNKKEFKFIDKLLENEQFNSAKIDQKGTLWLGTIRKGLRQIKNIETVISDKEIQPFTADIFTDNVDRLRISSFFSSSNTIWVGTFNEGLYQFDIKENPFNKYDKQMDYQYGIASNNVTHISSLDQDRVYITASYGGFGLFNTKTKKFEPLPFNLPKNYLSNVSSVFLDSKKNVWLKIANYGFFRVKSGEKNLVKIKDKVFYEKQSVSIRSFTEDKFGNIWIGMVSGVLKISLNKANEIIKIESLNENPFFREAKLRLVRSVYSDPLKNFIWIGSDTEGLFRIENSQDKKLVDLKIEKFVNDKQDNKSLSSNFVTSIVRLPNNDLWIGTENGGICKVIEENNALKFISFSEKQGLSNNVVKSILYDDENNLWVATNIGLNKFDIDNKIFRQFNLADGLPFEDFWYSSEKLKNGMLLFSGLDGFSYFKPTKIINSEVLPEVSLENFKIFNKKIYPGDTINNRVLFKKSISEISQVKLKYNENVFSFDITSLHFSNPKNHLIKYKLNPIDKDWVELPSNLNTIGYNGLQPDTYELEFLASNSLNEWTAPKKFSIIITPPFWKTPLAYFLYVILIILILYAIIYSITKIQSLNHKVAIEKLEIDTVKELNESKLRFFSNISHEIKTPITLISGPVEVLLNNYKNNFDISEKLKLVKRQTKKIEQLVNQAHDFRRAEANLLKMNYSRFNFNQFITEITDDFMFLASKDQKKFELIAKDENIIVSGDKDKIEKICNNLINNSFKYTTANDTIKIEFGSNGKDLNIVVTDTGMGIDEVDLTHIFERFYQSQSTQKEHIAGSGIGLAFSKKLVEMHYGYINVKSTLNEGTSISVQLPIVKKQVEKDEVLDKSSIELPKEKEVFIDKKTIKKEASSLIKVTGNFSESLIFYAEDNLEMRVYVSGILSKYFNIKVFRNGQECLDALEDNWPDLIISDVQMPILDGLDLCIAVKSDLKTSHIPVILLTALTNIEDHVRGIRDGADAYIKKPFNVQRLITNVEALLENRQKLRERYQVGIPLTKENNKNNRNDNAFLEKLYSIMEENLDNQDFDINSLSKELYLNRTHFYQKVKVLTNKTPFELIKIYRLKKAAQFLVQEKLSVNEVFSMTGFKSRTHFTKVFKEKYNVSPSKYAAENEKNFS